MNSVEFFGTYSGYPQDMIWNIVESTTPSMQNHMNLMNLVNRVATVIHFAVHGECMGPTGNRCLYAHNITYAENSVDLLEN
jgi:hypothetical protein